MAHSSVHQDSALLVLSIVIPALQKTNMAADDDDRARDDTPGRRVRRLSASK